MMIRICILIAAVLGICAPVPAAAQSSDPVMLLVNPKSGLKSVADFVAWAKKSKKPLAYSSSGPPAQRFGEALARSSVSNPCICHTARRCRGFSISWAAISTSRSWTPVRRSGKSRAAW